MNKIEIAILKALSKCGGKYKYTHSATVIGEVITNCVVIGDDEIYQNILNLTKQDKPPVLLKSVNISKENVRDLAYRYTEIKLSAHGKRLLQKICQDINM